MQSYAKPQLDAGQSQALWQAMLREIARQGLDATAVRILLWKLPVFSLLLALGLATAWHATNILLVVLACLGLALVLAQFAFLGHDAGHGSLSRSRWFTATLGQYCMTVVTGLAFEEWYQRHKTHHQFCQHEAKDPDMDVNLVVSLTAASRAKKNALGRFFTRYQDISVWFLSLFFAHSQRHLSQFGALQSPRRFVSDIAVMCVHFALWIGLPLLAWDIPLSRVLLVYTLPLFMLGPYLAAIFWVNHVGMPLIENLDTFDFLEHQTVTSRTVTNPRGMDWFFGGLNYQIEHHLFPQIPSFRLRRVQAIVRPAFQEQALPYNAVSFWGAVRQVAAHFRAIAKGQD